MNPEKPDDVLDALEGTKLLAARVEAELGVTTQVLRELIKPLVMLMHEKRLPFITIKLNNGIATVSTAKPNEKSYEHQMQ